MTFARCDKCGKEYHRDLGCPCYKRRQDPRPGVARRDSSKTTHVKTEDGLQCQDCGWIGFETEENRADIQDDCWFGCPVCGAECSHWPIDELGEPLPARRER